MTSPDARALAADPRWLPDALDPGRGTVRFARLPRTALASQAFLDGRKNGAVEAWAEARLDDLARAAEGLAPAPPRFVFHSAFCGSTLLARALDSPGACLALKEPNILLDLVNARRVNEAWRSPARFDAGADLILRLLARPHEGAETILIKPTNSASPLARFALARGMPSVFLYGSLRDFLLSLLKKGEEGRAFGRQQFNVFRLDPPDFGGTGLALIDPRQAVGLTDLQASALVWRHQLEAVAGYLAIGGAALDYAGLVANPHAALGAVSAALRLPLSPEALAAAAAGPVFRTHAKFGGQAFDAGARDAENAALEARYGADLDRIVPWTEGLDLGVRLALPLTPSVFDRQRRPTPAR